MSPKKNPIMTSQSSYRKILCLLIPSPPKMIKKMPHHFLTPNLPKIRKSLGKRKFKYKINIFPMPRKRKKKTLTTTKKISREILFLTWCISFSVLYRKSLVHLPSSQNTTPRLIRINSQSTKKWRDSMVIKNCSENERIIIWTRQQSHIWIVIKSQSSRFTHKVNRMSIWCSIEYWSNTSLKVNWTWSSWHQLGWCLRAGTCIYKVKEGWRRFLKTS